MSRASFVFFLIAAACGDQETPLDPRLAQLSRLSFLPGEDANPLLVDRFEVTREQYGEFLRSSNYRGEGFGFLWDWQGQDRPPTGLETHPVVFVSRKDAEAFAAWRGMRLPRSAEWELLSCGFVDPRADPLSMSTGTRVLYPWGNAWQSLYANTLEMGLGKTTPVGAFESGRSEYGCYDTAGNVWEWIASEENPGLGIAKGGAFDYGREKAQCFESLDLDPEQRNFDVGFRCVGEFAPTMLRLLGGLRPRGADLEALRQCARRWGPAAVPALAAIEREGKLDGEMLRAMSAAARQP